MKPHSDGDLRTRPGGGDGRLRPSQTELKSLEFGCGMFTVKWCTRRVMGACWLSALFQINPRARIHIKVRPKRIHRLLKTSHCNPGELHGAKRRTCPDGQMSQSLAMSPQQRCHQLYSSFVYRPGHPWRTPESGQAQLQPGGLGRAPREGVWSAPQEMGIRVSQLASGGAV